MSEIAWTVGNPEAYEKAIRIPGNAKAPGGVVYKTRLEAEVCIAEHEETCGTGTYRPYEILLPGPWTTVTTLSRKVSHKAFHRWHRAGADGRKIDLRCAICRGDDQNELLRHSALVVEAPFVVDGSVLTSPTSIPRWD